MGASTLRVLRAGIAGVGLLIAFEGGRAASGATPLEVFRKSCLECHDTDGKGEATRAEYPTIPDFTDRRWHASRSDAELSRSILEGRGKSMPRMKSKLGSVDVQRMVAFVRGFAGGTQVVSDTPDAPALPDPVARGKTLFQRSCVRCHGADGRGTAMRETAPSLPDFTGRAWQAGRTDPQLRASILGGKGTGMPAFQSRLGRDQVRELVAYVRALGPSPTAVANTAADDFADRFQQLEREVEALARQFHALSAPPRQP
jgi:mono/diheme cytochrome c family protein